MMEGVYSTMIRPYIVRTLVNVTMYNNDKKYTFTKLMFVPKTRKIKK
jgi:hypothetical protein